MEGLKFVKLMDASLESKPPSVRAC